MMKIVRDGKEIELMPEEMRQTLEEQQSEYDRQDLESICETNEYELTDDEKNEAIRTYRSQYDSEDWYYQMRQACETVMMKRSRKNNEG